MGGQAVAGIKAPPASRAHTAEASRRASSRKPGLLTEFSGRKGYYIWIFFNSPAPNRVARTLGKALTQKHEVFPKQDHIPKRGVGSLVKAPLGIHRGTSVRCPFLDQDLQPLPEQHRALAQVEAIDPVRVLKRHFPQAWYRVEKARGPRPPSSSIVGAPATMPSPVLLIKDCVQAAIQKGTGQGSRNQVGYIIATELRRTGMPIVQARSVLLSTWNSRNCPPLSEVEIDAIISSAYSGAVRTFGCRPGVRAIRSSGRNWQGPLRICKGALAEEMKQANPRG